MNNAMSGAPSRVVIGAMVTGIAMMTAVLWMPASLGALAQTYGLGPTALSHLAFAELIGFLLGTLFVSNRTFAQLRRWVPVGCALIVVASAWFILRADHPPAGWSRLVSGFGSGIGFGYGLKTCAASAKQTRSFGILTAAMSLVMVIGFQFVAYLSESLSAANSGGTVPMAAVPTRVFGTYATVAVLAAVVFVFNRPPAAQPHEAQLSAPRGVPSTSVLIGLLAIGLAFVGQGGIWAFLQVLGVSHGFSVGAVANAMSAFAIAGIAGSLAAASVPARWPRWSANASALIVLCIGLYAMYSPATLAWYVAGCAVGGFYWNFTLPLILGLLARLDDTGRGAVLGGTMSSLGSALGPLLAGLLITQGDYRPAGWLAAWLCLASLVCVWSIERRSTLKYASVPMPPA
jgi:predicted MFS family arabinose efflux permease